MAEELQSLLDRIQRDGVDKATAEREQILATARQEAAAMVRQAEEKAAEMRRQAEADATLMENRAKAAVQQAARDILLALRAELQRRLQAVVLACTGEALTPERMGELIVTMQRAYLERHGNDDAPLDILLGAKDLENLEALCRGALGKDLKAQPHLTLGNDVGAGLKLGRQGEDLFVDVTDEAIADLVCAYVGPRLAALLKDAPAQPTGKP